jgi:hypothetical protein
MAKGKCARMKISALALMLLLCASGVTQAPTPKAKKDQPKAPLPVFQITLTADTDYPSMPWREHLFGPIQGDCNGDGNLYIWEAPQGLVGLTNNGIVSFLSDKMTDIPGPGVSGAYSASLSRSGIYLRVGGIEKEDAEGGESEIWTDKDGHHHAGHSYIARFDKDGTYKGAIRIDLPFVVSSFAAFDSGRIVLAQGLEQEKIPRVALLDSSAQFLRYLDLRKDISPVQAVSSGDFKCDGCTADTRSVANNSTFTPWNGRMLFFRNLTSSPRVYEIQEGGEIRVVNLKPPQGYRALGLFPTDTNWLVSFRSPAGVWSLFEVDPQNGELLKEYRMKAPDKVPDTIISCFFDGKFLGFRHDVKEGKLEVVRGMAEPYRGK